MKVASGKTVTFSNAVEYDIFSKERIVPLEEMIRGVLNTKSFGILKDIVAGPSIAVVILIDPPFVAFKTEIPPSKVNAFKTRLSTLTVMVYRLSRFKLILTSSLATFPG